MKNGYIHKTELTREILQLQKQIAQAMRANAPEAWMGLNLTIGQLKSLLFIEFEGETNFKYLAMALGVSPPNVTGIVDRLVEQALVRREENPENRRMQLLTVTDKGKALLAELKERGDTHMSGVLTLMNTEDLAALAQGLAALVRAAEQNRENISG